MDGVEPQTSLRGFVYNALQYIIDILYYFLSLIEVVVNMVLLL